VINYLTAALVTSTGPKFWKSHFQVNRFCKIALSPLNGANSAIKIVICVLLTYTLQPTSINAAFLTVDLRNIFNSAEINRVMIIKRGIIDLSSTFA
jgi:hypothetical protein